MPLIRPLTSRTATHLDDLLVGHVRTPLFWSIALLGVLVAASVAGLEPEYRSAAVSAVLSVLIFLWMLFAVRASRLFLSASSLKARPNALVRPQTLPLFINLAAIAIIVCGVYFIFQAWHVERWSTSLAARI